MLSAVRPSPARIDAPEPDVWFPLGPIDDLPTLELPVVQAKLGEAPDEARLEPELDLLALEAGRADFDSELRALQADFWSTAARRLRRGRGPDPGSARPRAPSRGPPPGRRPRRSAVAVHGRRNRIVGTVLLVAVLGAFAAVGPSVVGASVPQRDITVSIDGQTFSRTVRAGTVGEVLTMEGITLAADDRVVPGADTPLSAGMAIAVHRAFPVAVDIDGVVTTVRTTRTSPLALRRDLGVGAGLLIGAAPRVLGAGTKVEFRTPHDVTLQVDGTTVPLMRTGALDVGSLLVAQGIALGPKDEVTPGAGDAAHQRHAHPRVPARRGRGRGRARGALRHPDPRRPEPAGGPDPRDPGRRGRRAAARSSGSSPATTAPSSPRCRPAPSCWSRRSTR